MKPGKHHRNNQRWQDLRWKVHEYVHNLLLCVHTLRINYVANTFLLVSYSVQSKHVLCFVQAQIHKKANKNIQQRTFSGFITISLY